VTLAEVFTMSDQQGHADALRAIVLARIEAIGAAEVARRVAPLWGWQPREAASRLSRFKKGTSMPSDALFALLVVLGFDLVLCA
jgi:hypothetical protein